MADTALSVTGRFLSASNLPAPAKPVWRRGSALTRTMPGLRAPVCPVEVDDAQLPPAGPDENAAQAATLLEERLRGKPEQAEEDHARDPQHADARRVDASDQNPCGHGGAPGQERPGHLAPVEEVGH